MKFSKLTFLLAILALMLPFPATANSVNVQTDNVRVGTNKDGSTYVHTRDSSVQVPARSNSSNRWYYWQNWRFPWSRGCQNQVYQRTTQTTQSGGRVIHSSTSNSSHNCR